jgi:hypothetical protein
MTWATLADARERWRESSAVDDARLTGLLALAFEKCAEKVRPATWADPATPGPYPSRLVEANVLAAKDTWSVMTSTTGDVIGFDAYALRRRPLSDEVLALLDPPLGVPKVG